MKATNWKLGLSTCGLSIDKELFNEYAKAGIEEMEISFGRDVNPPIDWKNVPIWAKDAGVGLWSYHLPFLPFEQLNIASLKKELRDQTVDYCLELIKKASGMGIKIAVLHPSGEPNPDNVREEMLKCAAESIAELQVKSKPYGVTIAVEDLPRSCLGNHSSDIKKLISLNEDLRVCFDTNHLLIQKNSDFIKDVGSKIITLHVSDYDFRNEQHWLPYEGKVDWVELVTLLEEVGYSGPFLYELGLQANKFIERRELTYLDFRKNYEAIVNKKVPEILGKPVEEELEKRAYFKTVQF